MAETQSIKKKPGRKPREPQENKEVTKTYQKWDDTIVNNMFALYFQGKDLTEIRKLYNVPEATMYRIAKVNKWEERKQELGRLSVIQAEVVLVDEKAKQLKMASTMINIVGSSILQKYKDGGADFSVRDFVSAIRAYNMLKNETADIPNINIQNNTFNTLPTNVKVAIDKMLDKMTPQERGFLIDVQRNIDTIKQQMARVNMVGEGDDEFRD